MTKEKKDKKWVQKADLHKGAFTAKAKKCKAAYGQSQWFNESG